MCDKVAEMHRSGKKTKDHTLLVFNDAAVCQMCDDPHAATHLCVDCNSDERFICQARADTHKSGKKTKTHTLFILPERNSSSAPEPLATSTSATDSVGFAPAAAAARLLPYQDVRHDSSEAVLPSTVFTDVFKNKNQTVSPWKRFLEAGVYWYIPSICLCGAGLCLLYSTPAYARVSSLLLLHAGLTTCPNSSIPASLPMSSPSPVPVVRLAK